MTNFKTLSVAEKQDLIDCLNSGEVRLNTDRILIAKTINKLNEILKLLTINN